MAQIETGASVSGKVNVDAGFNLKTTGPTTPDQYVGFGALAGRNDDGTITGTPRVKRIWATEAGRILVAPTMLLWDDTFNATAQNTAKYRWAATTQTGAQASGVVTLNNGGITTINTDCALQTFRQFPLFGSHELRCTISGFILTAFPHVANNTIELGLFTATLPGQAAPTDGVFFRYNASNELRGVISYNGTETQTAAITPPSTNVSHDFMIIVQNDVALFWIDRILVGSVTLLTDATSQGQPFMSGSVPVTVRQRIGGSAPANATKFSFSDIYVQILGIDVGRTWGETKAGYGHMAYQGQNGGTMGTTALYANSANPTAAVPTNTTAALGTGLGGNFWETPTLALGSDGIISSFQVPVGSVNQTPRSLIVRGVKISSVIQTVLAGGPVARAWSLAFGHTAVSLATAESGSFVSPTTKAPRRVALGHQVVTAAQAVATLVSGDGGSALVARFDGGPVVVGPGEFIQTVVRSLTGGTVPTSGTIQHHISFDAYLE